jgi:glycine reductase
MGLEDQAAVKRVADEHGSGVVVLLGTPDAESTQTLAQTVVAGDPSYAGPLAGVPLGLPVLHVFESQVKDQVPPDVYEAQVALMEMSLDRDAILGGLQEARRATVSGTP